MSRKWIVGLIAVVAAVGFGGVGFAVFTSTATITTTATAGTFTLTWTTATATPACGANTCGSGSPPETCSTTGTPTPSLIVSISNFNGGDTCTLVATLTDTGSLPGSFPATSWNTASDFTITPNSPGVVANSITAGGTITMTWVFTAVSSSTDIFTLTIVGTAT